MLVVISPTRVINIDKLNQINIETTNYGAAYIKFGSGFPAKCESLDAAIATLAGIVDAYARGEKVFYINKE